MPSPFPGMDPYLENPGDWQGVHATLLIDLQRALVAQIGDDYRVQLEQKLYVERDDGSGDVFFARADVGTARRRPQDDTGGGTAVATPAPTTVRIPTLLAYRRPRRWLTIRDRRRRVVVTVIELLSPTDKRLGTDRDNYLVKRERILGSSAALVEIDLLRGGHRAPVEGRPVCDYCVLVSRPVERPEAGVWAWTLRDPMPTIPIPLRPGEAEPQVSLRAVLDQSYDASQLGRGLYAEPPEPPLSGTDAAWAAELLKPPSPTRGRKRPPR